MAGVSEGNIKQHEGETVIIAMDGSEYSDYALQCKCFLAYYM